MVAGFRLSLWVCVGLALGLCSLQAWGYTRSCLAIGFYLVQGFGAGLGLWPFYHFGTGLGLRDLATRVGLIVWFWGMEF